MSTPVDPKIEMAVKIGRTENVRAVVTDGRIDFWRGGQPPDAAAWSEIADVLGTPDAHGLVYGVVLKLNTEDQGDDSPAERCGLRIVRCPISSAEQVFEPHLDRENVRRALGVLAGARPVYLHCVRGRERSGSMVALYRVHVLGWTREAAWSEALACGLRPQLVPALVDLFETFEG